MNTIEYLKAVKAKTGISSDYALAARLGITRSAVSKLQAGGVTLSDDVALSVAQILGIEPIEVIASANAERAKTPEMRARWLDLMKGFRTLLSHAKFAGQERRLSPR